MVDELFPLDDISSKDINTSSLLETKIPIPSTDFLKKTQKQQLKSNGKGTMTKYEKEYDLFCHWAALPKDLREPASALEFERKYQIPKNYSAFFKQKEDFQNRRLKYFWEWLYDLYPDVVYAVYKRAIAKSSKDASIFVDIMGKHLDIHKPQVNVQPMVLVGVPQEKIDKLFTPKSYENTEKIVPATIVDT